MVMLYIPTHLPTHVNTHRETTIQHRYFTNQGVSPAAWGVATSVDGIHFDLVTLRGRSSQYPGAVDGNALLIDDDGTG